MQIGFANLTLAELSVLVRKRSISPVELTRFFLERIDRFNPVLNAYITVTAEQALEDARKMEREIVRGRYRSVLHGIPFSVKDVLATRAVRTTAGSKILRDYVPDYDATVVARLRRAGGILLGKTNMHEWGAGSTTINPFYGTTRNPWDTTRIAGGSSGGSGAAIASGLSVISIGTDNAGSVRHPAALCGIVGIKPTFGRVSRFGTVTGPGGYSTECVGILTRTVKDAAIGLEIIAGFDENDPMTVRIPIPTYSKNLGKAVAGLTVGLVRGYFDEFMSSETRKVFYNAVKAMKSLGITCKEISIPHMHLVPVVQICTSRVENLTAHFPYLRTRPRDYSSALLQRNIVAMTIPASAYVTAQKVRRVLCDEFDKAFEEVDVILAPTEGLAAPTIEECEKGFVEIDGERIMLQDTRGTRGTLCTIPFNLTGHPAISICSGFSPNALPVGMQIVGRAFREDMILRLAHAYEQMAGWHLKAPPAS
jgi:aspartyl-tRNA(Asn)/glutamyl-tRNA(Gln) amidotransferase subunit A